MPLNAALAYCAAIIGLGLMAIPFLSRSRGSIVWSFVIGMLALALQSLLDGLSLAADAPHSIAMWQDFSLGLKCCLPLIWIFFSLVYSRGNHREFVWRWRVPLAAASLLPVTWLTLLFAGFALVGVATKDASKHVWLVAYSSPARLLVFCVLVAYILILANLEKTFRASVGAMRWRIKFMVLGLGVIFGVRIYTQSQVLLFSGHNLALAAIEAGGLIIGGLLTTLVYTRRGFNGIDVYPSHAVLQSSVTVLLAGGYLFIVGVLAQVAARVGKAQNFQAQVFVVLLGIVGLVILLFSDRQRQRVGRFVSRHFRRPEHNFRQIWTQLTHQIFESREKHTLATAAVKLVSDTFQVLSVTFWEIDENRRRFSFVASTSPLAPAPVELTGQGLTDALLDFDPRVRPGSLEKITAGWATAMRQANPKQFPHSGDRLCVPLTAGERGLGVLILADRVNRVPYTEEEIDLLACVGDQIAAGLLNLQLTGDLMQAKELEAFQSMSTFFVHDLKNAAYSLGLMLENLPVHFDDPDFRADALRGIGSTVGRINQLIERLGAFRSKAEVKPTRLDLNQLVRDTLATLPAAPAGVEVRQELSSVPSVCVDREQIQSVLTNLILNAFDASGPGGRVEVLTGQFGSHATLKVRDNGAGMSAEFIRDSLFRPFVTTKKKGLGIGMFQSKMIVEANRGSMEVESQVGKGTVFQVALPLS